MGLYAKLKIWCSNSGNKTERSDSDIADGWHEGEAPLYSEWNYQENIRDRHINANTSMSRALGTLSPGVSPAALCGRDTVNDQWADPDGPLNRYIVGDNVIESFMGWDSSDDTAVLWVLDASGLIRPITNCWDLENAPILGADLGLSYPVTPGGVLSACCDASYLYVMWYRDSDDVISVSRFEAIGGTFNPTADWTYTTPHTFLVSYPRGFRLIDALDGSNVSLYMPRLVHPFTLIGVLSKDGATYTSGIGNLPASNLTQNPQLHHQVSDGVHIYWLSSYDSAGIRYTYINSAKITAVSSSDYTHTLVAGADLTAAPENAPRDLVAGDGVVVCATQSGRVFRFRNASDRVDPVIATTPEFSDTTSDHGAACGTDHLNIWIASKTLDTSDDTDTITFYRIPRGMCGPYSGRSSFGDAVFFPRLAVPNSTGGYPGTRAGNFEFDGRSLWYIDSNGYLYRITNPGGR